MSRVDKELHKKYHKEYNANVRSKIKEFGIEISKENSRSIADGVHEPELEWVTKIWVPFSYKASKNSIYGRSSHKVKGPYLSNSAKDIRDEIALKLKSAIRITGVTLKRNKVWVDIFVEKSNHLGDAVNVIDLVCDSIKLAIPIDDRWYCIRRLDWSVNRHDPKIIIGIGQEFGVVDSSVCSSCGTIVPDTDLNKSSRICKPCRTMTRPGNQDEVPDDPEVEDVADCP